MHLAISRCSLIVPAQAIRGIVYIYDFPVMVWAYAVVVAVAVIVVFHVS